ncbi:MAG: uncharacterized protein QG670_452 [Thermoproteota archaeon]|nr:uncharacterized protein [Thermoproteota archaeon]
MMPFHNINDSSQSRVGNSVERFVSNAMNVVSKESRDLRGMNFASETLIADALRMMVQGTKVYVEIVAITCDSELLESRKNVIVIVGTGHGADTVLILKTTNSRRLLDTIDYRCYCKTSESLSDYLRARIKQIVR